MLEPLSEAEAAGGLGTYVKPKDLTQVPDFEHVRGEPKNIVESVKSEENLISEPELQTVPDNDVEM